MNNDNTKPILPPKRQYLRNRSAKKDREIPTWVNECISSPQDGIKLFLELLCEIGNAPYIHIRVRSRSGKFFKMVESIGIYKDIGWPRRFHLLDKKDNDDIYYHFINYTTSKDCIAIKNKFANDPKKYEFLNKINHGFWLPLKLNDIELGYITLTWETETLQRDKAQEVRKYIKAHNDYIPVVYQACRNIIADKNLSILWSDAAAISSASEEHECYDKICEACLHLWGDDATVYIYKITKDKKHYEIISVMGRRANEIKRNDMKKQLPVNRGLVGHLRKNKKTFISYSLATDSNLKRPSVLQSNSQTGSAIATRISDTNNENPIAFIVVEHDLDNYFDVDDLRYITGIARIGYENISSHMALAINRAREFDILFTQMAHDVVEPIQALVADAVVLKYETTKALNYLHQPINIDTYLADTLERTTNFMEEALNLNKRVRKHLDTSGSDSTMTVSLVRVYTMLNTLADTWRTRAESQGVELKPLYDSLRDVKVYCDESELKASLHHLMTNAIKYSFWGRKQSQGGIMKLGRYVAVIGRKREKTFSIEFQNYGIGILKREMNRITEKFYRGELARREGKAGTGRGLWSVKSFVESLGGKLIVTSIQQSSDIYGPYSTTVTIQLPIASEEKES